MLAAVDRANAALRVDETSAQVVPDIGELRGIQRVNR